MTKIPDIEWCEVPAGEFIMGGVPSWDGEPQIEHTVNLRYDYKAAKYPITNAQYRLFVEAGGYNKRQYWTVLGWKWKEENKRTAPHNYGEPFNLPNHPVVGVSWYEAVAYCHWLTEDLRERGELAQDWQIRLPTEAEWEKAARGTDGRKYTWGNELDSNKANYSGTKVGSTSAVGFFLQGQSPYGCQDMAGNVWEWCATKHGKPYPYKIGNEWAGAYLADETRRNARGSSWDYGVDYLRCAYRGNSNPFDYNYGMGFRCFCVPIF